MLDYNTNTHKQIRKWNKFVLDLSENFTFFIYVLAWYVLYTAESSIQRSLFKLSDHRESCQDKLFHKYSPSYKLITLKKDD